MCSKYVIIPAIVLALGCYFGCNEKRWPFALEITNEEPTTADEVLRLLNSNESLQPVVDPERYRCEQILPLVNKLRHLGKARALAVLSQYYRESEQSSSASLSREREANVIVISRLLFVPPTAGWTATDAFEI